MMKTRQIGGFTLVELLVVISIIVLIASMSAPAITEFRRQHRLKASFQTIQGAFIRARNEAISKRKKVHVVLLFTLTNGDANGNGLPDFDLDGNSTAEGPLGTVHTLMETPKGAIDETTGLPLAQTKFEYIAPVAFLSEFTKLENPTKNFIYTFNIDGTMFFQDDRDPPKGVEDPTEDNANIDIIIVQDRNPKKCYVDVVRNTGRVIFSIRE